MSEHLAPCPWAKNEDFYLKYHDEEWGVPLYDSQALFAMLCLEGAQAGLSWRTILQRRAHYYRVFDQFQPEKIAVYDSAKQQALLNDSGIIRNRLKIQAFIENARAFLRISEKQDFSQYLWYLAGGKAHINYWQHVGEIPASTSVSQNMSRVLKKAGFRFVGETICYAFMQATGMVNDHLTSCYCHPQNQPHPPL